ncbi:MAG TPA: alpha-amylase family glycosyl hydrolase, partial [Longimicrobiales bacterium]
MPETFQDIQFTTALSQAQRPRRIAIALGGPGEEGKQRQLPKPFPSPTDWRDHWIYFVMVDRFNNPAAPPRLPWDRSADARQGGTLEGVRQQLAYIKQLGAGAIWLTPVLKNRQFPPDGSYHGYGIQDFTSVDPRFGSAPGMAEAELERLVDEAHARGLYVILDIVLNHAGDVFAYETPAGERDAVDWSDEPYTIEWRGPHGEPEPNLEILPAPEELPPDAAIWPKEFQRNEWFRRQGKARDVLHGDFESLKEFRTELTDEYGDKPVWNLLIRAYQYVIARYDVDGFRVDTLKHVEREFAMSFCNAMREFALSIGKRNFFIYGESRDGNDSVLAAYTGRYASEDPDFTGADAALDFPLQWRLVPVTKGFASPAALRDLFLTRKRLHESLGLLSTHGDASRFYVTFLDCHDDAARFLYPRGGGDWTDQLTLALGCLFTLQGIPCVYYGTEQGLKGTADLYDADPQWRPENVREALWGKDNAF